MLSTYIGTAFGFAYWILGVSAMWAAFIGMLALFVVMGCALVPSWRQRGPLLLDMGHSFGNEEFRWLFRIGGLCGIFLGLTNILILSRIPGGLIWFIYAAIQFGMGSFRLQMCGNGLCVGINLIAWDDIEAYEWRSDRIYFLMKRRNRVTFQRYGMVKIPEYHRIDMANMLHGMCPGREVAALHASVETT